MKVKIQISKKTICRLAIFVAIIALASLLDMYLEKYPIQIDSTKTTSNKPIVVYDLIYFNQVNTFSVKTTTQKTPDQKVFQRSHDKFLQQYHKLRNYEMLKTGVKKEKIPFYLTCHHFIFRDHYFSFPDDDSLYS